MQQKKMLGDKIRKFPPSEELSLIQEGGGRLYGSSVREPRAGGGGGGGYWSKAIDTKTYTGY